MKVPVDMNLSPEWLEVLSRAGWEASHWSAVGSPTAEDLELLIWARDHNHVLLTQDLDFGQLLFHTRFRGPSVVILRNTE
jgi:predicted nuclease of predicted toxin-antitoxin system